MDIRLSASPRMEAKQKELASSTEVVDYRKKNNRKSLLVGSTSADTTEILPGDGKCCTYAVTKNNSTLRQRLYYCSDCFELPPPALTLPNEPPPLEIRKKYVCTICAIVCHAGHNVQYVGTELTGEYCKCRKSKPNDSGCNALPVIAPDNAMKVVVPSKKIDMSVSEEECLHVIEDNDQTVSVLVVDETIFCCTEDNPNIKMWDLNNGTFSGLLKGHQGAVLCLAAMGDFLYSGSSDRTIREWNLKSGEKLVLTSAKGNSGHTKDVTALEFANNKLYSGSSDCTILEWDLRLREYRPFGSHQQSVTCLKAMKDYLFSGSYDETIRQWNLQTGECVNVIDDPMYTGSIKQICAVYYTDTLRYRLLCAYGLSLKHAEGTTGTDEASRRSIHVWEIDDKNKVTKYGMWQDHEAGVTSVLVSRVHQNRLFTGSLDRTIRIWDVKTGECIQVLKNSKALVNCAYNTNDRIIVGCSDNRVRIWKTHIEASLVLDGHQHRIMSIFVHNDELYTASLDSTVRIWDIRTGRCLKVLYNDYAINTATIQDRTLFIASADMLIRAWDLETGEIIQTFKGHRGAINQILLVDERLYSCSRDNKVIMWNTHTGRILCEFEQHDKPVYCMAYWNSYLFTGSDDCNIGVWRAKDGYFQQFLSGHTAWLNTLAIGNVFTHEDSLTTTVPRLFSGSKDRSIRIWNPETLECLVVLHTQASVYCISVQNDRLYAGLKDGTVSAWDCSNWQLSEFMIAHVEDVRSICSQGNFLYTGSSDKTVRIWNLQMLLAPNVFLKTCFSVSMMKEQGYPQKKDTQGRNALMLMASYGMIGSVKSVNQDFFESNARGESPFYFALKFKRWELLKLFSAIPLLAKSKDKEKQDSQPYFIKIALASQKFKKPSDLLLQLLMEKARFDDINFFKPFFELGLDKLFNSDLYDASYTGQLSLHSLQRLHETPTIIDIVAQSFLQSNPKLRVFSYWLHLNKHSENQLNARGLHKWTMLHYACFYGCVQATRLLLLDQAVQINVYDDKENSPLHVALPPSQEIPKDKHLKHVMLQQVNSDQLDEKRGLRTENELLLARIECAKRVVEVEENWRKPELFQRNAKNHFAFQRMILAHNDARKALQVKRARADQVRTKQELSAFDNTLELISKCSNFPSVESFRKRVALRTFFKQAIPYMVWLILLTVVCFNRVSHNSSERYYFTQSVTDAFVGAPIDNTGQTFNNINTLSDFWKWFEGPLASSLSDAMVSGASSDDYANGHRLIGAVSLRQLRVVPNKCFIPDQFKETIHTCYPSSFIEDRSNFGPPSQPNKYFWSDGGTRPYLVGLFGDSYPGSGFILTFPGNESSVLDISEQLQKDQWIDGSTRIVIIEFALYDVSLNIFSMVRIGIEKPASGQILPFKNINTVEAFKYETTEDFVMAALECLIVVYFVLEFIYFEFHELIAEGKNYFKDLWNYYEIILIAVFLSVVGMRVWSELIVYTIHFEAPVTEYVELQLLGTIIDYEQKLSGVLLGMTFLRVVKFLQIPEFSGVTVRSILDTMINKSFIAFIAIFIFVIFSFAIAFHMAFGVYLFPFRDLEKSFFYLVDFVFGNIDDSVQSQNRFFGPAFFLIYTFGSSFILINMFIAVISDVYVGVHKQHKDFWERHMLLLMIKAVVKSERVYSTTGDLIGHLYIFILKATFVSKLIQKWQKRQQRKKFEEALLAGIDWSDDEDDDSSEDFSDDETDSLPPNAMELPTLKDSKQSQEQEDISFEIDLESITTTNSLKMGKKERTIVFNQSDLDKLTFDFFLHKSTKAYTTTELALQAKISELQQDIQQIKQLLLNNNK